jgi:hypothetical protein
LWIKPRKHGDVPARWRELYGVAQQVEEHLLGFTFDGDESTWTGTLDGSKDALTDFLNCARRLSGNGHATQPFNRATQPYSAGIE